MSVSTVDPFGGLEGEDRDAYMALSAMLTQYGLESLASSVLGFLQQGYSEDTVSLLLAETDAYKQRFAANESRRQKGLRVLSPAEYIATEDAYRQVMSQAGLPVGYYDQPEDFRSMMVNDLSPSEVQQRVTVAADIVNNLDPNVLSEWERFYTRGDIVAYALDPERATTVLERQASAAKTAAYGASQGLSVSQDQAERVGALAPSEGALRQGLATASALASNSQRLSGIYGGTYTDDAAVAEVFTSDQGATRQRRRLASAERGAFSGSSALTERSLSKVAGGSL